MSRVSAVPKKTSDVLQLINFVLFSTVIEPIGSDHLILTPFKYHKQRAVSDYRVLCLSQETNNLQPPAV